MEERETTERVSLRGAEGEAEGERWRRRMRWLDEVEGRVMGL